MRYSKKELDNIKYNVKYHKDDIFTRDAKDAWAKIVTDLVETLAEIYDSFTDDSD
jgi:hypothetical protein